MRSIDWTPKSIRAFKRLIRKNPQLRPLIEKALRQLMEDPFHPSLRTHKLIGDLSDIWSCSVDYSYRLLVIARLGGDKGKGRNRRKSIGDSLKSRETLPLTSVDNRTHRSKEVFTPIRAKPISNLTKNHTQT